MKKTIYTILYSALLLLLSVVPAGAEEPGVADLLVAVGSSEEATRLEAIDQLGLRGEAAAEALPALVELLKDGSAPVRAHAAQALGRIGKPARPAVDALGELFTDADKRVARAAVRAVGTIRPGPEVGIPLFLKAVQGADPAVTLRAIDALADMGAEANPFLEAALRDKDAAYWACLIISEIGPEAKAMVPALTALLDDERPGVRREAILALSAIGEASAPAVPALLKALDDPINAAPATFALVQVGKVSEELAAKIKQNAEGADAVLSTVSVWALARLHPDDKALQRQAVEMLVERLSEGDERQRQAAARALISLEPDPEIAQPIVAKAMDGASPEVLGAMLDAVAAMGPKALPRMIAALEAPAVRARAAAIIGRIGPEAGPAVPALIKALADENDETRNEVLFALGAIGAGAAEAVPAVAERLGDPSDKVRYAACMALGKIGAAARTAKGALASNLAGEDAFLAMASAWALASIDPRSPDTAAKAVPVLADQSQASDAMTRLHAVEALRKFGPLAAAAADELKKAAEDANEDVRTAASEALKAISAGAIVASPAQPTGLQPGMTALAGENGARVTLGGKELARIPKGTEFRVTEVRDNWVGVEVDLDGKTVRGWVNSADVSSESAAMESAPAEQAGQQLTPDQQAIRENAEAFVTAFNKGDAKAVAALWAENGEMSLDGEAVAAGREQVAAKYAEYFEQNSGAKIEVRIDSIEVLGPALAIERGHSEVINDDDESVADAYRLVYTKVDDAWLIASANVQQELIEPPYDWKADLEFLLGTWRVSEGDWSVTTEFEWVPGGNFLKRTFTVKDGDQEARAGVEIIGWDARERSITSWTFGEDGGHGRGWWVRDGDQWLIETQGVSPYGEEVAANNIITLLDDNTFRWQSTNRSFEGVKLEDTETVRVTRVRAAD